MNEQNSSFYGPPQKNESTRFQTPTLWTGERDLPGENALQCFSMSSWSVLAVRAARLWSVCMCVWLMSVRACPRVLGDSREQCGCLWFPDGLYCGGRWYVFLRKGPSRPFSPSYATDPPPPHPHPGDPSNYTNCINCTVKEDRVGQSIALQWLFFFFFFYCFYSNLDNPSVYLHVCACASCSDWGLLEVQNELWGWFSVCGLESEIPFLHHQQSIFPLRKTLSGLTWAKMTINTGAAAILCLLYSTAPRLLWPWQDSSVT